MLVRGLSIAPNVRQVVHQHAAQFSDRPLFLYFSPTSIHGPTMAPEATLADPRLDAINNTARRLVAAEVPRTPHVSAARDIEPSSAARESYKLHAPHDPSPPAAVTSRWRRDG